MVFFVVKVNSGFSPPGPYGVGGRIGNRVQIPNGTATVSVEAAPHGESRSLEASSEKAVERSWMRKSGELLKPSARQALQVRRIGGFWRRKTAAAACLLPLLLRSVLQAPPSLGSPPRCVCVILAVLGGSPNTRLSTFQNSRIGQYSAAAAFVLEVPLEELP